jgi:hypothetical protein
MPIELPSFRPGLYRHYKGGLYQAHGLAVEEATLRPVVMYTHLGDALTWTRPLESWQQIVNWPNGASRPRFVWVAKNSPDFLLSEKTELMRMLAETPVENVIDRASIEARIVEVTHELNTLVWEGR